MEPILAWIFLSIATQMIIEILVKVFPVLDEIEVPFIELKLIVALVFGILFAFGAGLDFFRMFNIDYAFPVVGEILAAVFIMAGASYIHELINAVNTSREVLTKKD